MQNYLAQTVFARNITQTVYQLLCVSLNVKLCILKAHSHENYSPKMYQFKVGMLSAVASQYLTHRWKC